MKNSIDFQKILSERERLISARDNNLVGLRQEQHRLQLIAEIKGVKYINDSRATKATDVHESLTAIPAPIVWLVDTCEINMDFSILKSLLGKKVKTVICLGENKEKFIDQLLNETKLFVAVDSLEEAIEMSSLYASDGDTILFSPGSPSRKPYENYRERGEHFNSLVKKLSQNEQTS